MAVREAKLRVTMDRGRFKSGLNDIKRDSKRAAQESGTAWSRSMKAGLASARGSFKGLVTAASGAIKKVGAIGGTLVTGKMILDAVSLTGKIQQFTEKAAMATGQVLDWRDVQSQLAAVSDDTRVSQERLLEAAAGVFKSTGNLDYSLGILQSIGKASQVTGDDVVALGEAGQLAFRKFGVTAEEFNERILPGLVEKLSGGGLSVQDLQGKFALLATEAESLGFKGGEGFIQLLGLAKQMDNELGESLVPGMKRLGEVMKGGTSQIRAIQGAFKKKKIELDVDKTGIDMLREIISKGPEGIEALQQAIRSPEARRTIDELVAPFQKAFAEAKAAGSTPAEAAKAGLDAFDARLFTFGKTVEDSESLQRRFNRLRDDPKMKLDEAMNKMVKTFSQPEMIEAINKLAESLPELATLMAKVVDFAVENPKTAATAAVAGKVGFDFLGGAVTGLAAQVVGGAAPAAPAAVTASRGAAGRMLGGAATRLGAGGAAGAALAGIALAAWQNSELKGESGGLGMLDIIGGMFKQGTLDPSKVVDSHMNQQAEAKAKSRRSEQARIVSEQVNIPPGGWFGETESKGQLGTSRKGSEPIDSSKLDSLDHSIKELTRALKPDERPTKENTRAVDRLSGVIQKIAAKGGRPDASRGAKPTGQVPSGAAPREG